MEVQREKDGLGFYEVKLTKGDSILTICFGGNGDLYWDLLNMEDMDSRDEYFTIDKNDGVIYDLFLELYSRVSNHQIFQVIKVEEDYCTSELERKELHNRKRMDNEELSTHPYFNALCNGEYIEWHSDNEPFETGNRLVMFQDYAAGEILINIIRVSRNYDYLNVCFTHSGSRYSPFDLAFYEHYKQLCEMELDKVPTHEDEVSKKLTK